MIGNDFNRIRKAAKELASHGIDCADFEARQLCAALCDEGALQAAIARRLSGEPLQYILGEWEFYGITLKTDKRALIPRADTETLVDAALGFLKNKTNPAVLDLCSGTGCVAIAIAKNAPAEVYAVEKYDSAFSLLRENIALTGVNITAVQADITEKYNKDKTFDLIVSNPPYIKTADMQTLQAEVKHEPETALHGGEDGCYFYRAIANNFLPTLKSGGMLAVEIGINQQNEAAKIFSDAGLRDIKYYKDIPGVIRVVSGIKP